MHRLLLCVCLCVIGSEGFSTNQYEIKGGTFPYMAIVYYMDETIVEDGKRFIRNAILIRPNWLVSSTIEVNGNTTFPRKTLVARAGADTIDARFTLYEEELEQDREIIQVVLPSKDKMESWGYETFPSLLKTITPFNMTSMVAPTTLAEKIHDYMGMSCFVIVYGYSNNSGDQNLMQWPIEVLSRDSCKTNADNLICSSYNTSAVPDFNLCLRNRGGPLVCEKKVVGLQSYLSGCQLPHLHIAVEGWLEFIDCGVKEKCATNPCQNKCTAFDKDPPAITGAVRTDVMTMASTVTSTEQMNDAERRNIASEVENKTTIAVNESSFAYLKEEIKRTSDIVAANIDTDATSSTFDKTEVVTNLTTVKTVTTLSTPTRTLELKMRTNMTRLNVTKSPKKASLRTRNQASVHAMKGVVFILVTIISVLFM